MLTHLLSILAPPLCIACGADAGRASPLCRECRLELAATRAAPAPATGVHAWSAFAYDGPAGAVARGLKFGGRTRLADVMAAQIAAHAPPALWTGTLVPVPLHPARLRRRGFNHAGLLADALARRTGLPVADCLRRRGDSAPQMGRGRQARMRALAGTISVTGPGAPLRALLVDDVVTTGATLAACARALSEAGCANVGAVTYARTRGR